jgi:hypothetical protein
VLVTINICEKIKNTIITHMNKIVYGEPAPGVLELEYDAWIQAGHLIEKSKWESEYHTYLASLEHSTESIRKNIFHIMA